PANLDRNIPALTPAELAQAVHESADHVTLRCSGGRVQKSDRRYLRRLLRAHRQRPRRGRAAEERDDRAAFHVAPTAALAACCPSVAAAVFSLGVATTRGSRLVKVDPRRGPLITRMPPPFF